MATFPRYMQEMYNKATIAEEISWDDVYLSGENWSAVGNLQSWMEGHIILSTVSCSSLPDLTRPWSCRSFTKFLSATGSSQTVIKWIANVWETLMIGQRPLQQWTTTERSMVTYHCNNKIDNQSWYTQHASSSMACGGEHREEWQSIQYLSHCAGPTPSSLFGKEFDSMDHRFASLVALVVDWFPCTARCGKVPHINCWDPS